MNRKTAKQLLMCSCIGICLLAGCGKNTDHSESSESSQSISNSEITDECYVTLRDGDEETQYPVKAYGEEFTLPECEESKDGEFYGWLSYRGLVQPGEKMVAEEFMDLEALRSNPDSGTLVLIDSVRCTCSHMTSEGEAMEIEDPDEYQTMDQCDEYFDYWTDEDGKKYEGKDSLVVENGKIVILNAVYSDDLSSAYKITYFYNSDLLEDEEEHYSYIKQGKSLVIPVLEMPTGYQFDGWYDDSEGGNLVANDSEPFTPDSDLILYAHWKQEAPKIVNIDQTLYYGTDEECIQVPRKAPDGSIKSFYPPEIMPDMPESANFGEEDGELPYMFLEDGSLIVQTNGQWMFFEHE